MSNFIEIVKNESWEEVFSQDDVNKSFNSFLHLFLIHFESCFPIQHNFKNKNSSWLTKGILVSCKWKRSLYILSMASSCPKLKMYHVRHCKILGKVIRAVKRNHYNKLLNSAENKTKVTWSIIRNETGKVQNVCHIPLAFNLNKVYILTMRLKPLMITF
jgi:hypothetical protein